MIWQATPQTKIVAQGDWVNWKRAFVDLPVTLTRGNNADINGLLGTDGIKDSVPLKWRDQYVSRIGIERAVAEKAFVHAGYAHANSPVPGSTLTPLTAVIMGGALSTGFGYKRGRVRFDAAYSLDLTAKAECRAERSQIGRVQQQPSECRHSVGIVDDFDPILEHESELNLQRRVRPGRVAQTGDRTRHHWPMHQQS